jgi:hypothetical protein
MVNEGKVLQSHPVQTVVPQGSPMSLILFAIHTAGLIKWVVERVHADGLSFLDNLGWITLGTDLNQVVTKLEVCVGDHTECASRQDIQFDTAKTEEALIRCR